MPITLLCIQDKIDCLLIAQVPETRAAAIALGRLEPSPTQEDYRKFNDHKAAKAIERAKRDWWDELTDEQRLLEDDGVWRKGLKAKSARWDNDWHRWSYCWDPWTVPTLKGVVYTYGSLNGVWLGRMLVCFFPLIHSVERISHFHI